MKLVVFGSTGKTGLEIVKQSLAQGFEVTAFLRDPSRMPFTNDRLQCIAGDVLNLMDVQKAVQKPDAVICALGTNSLAKTTIRSEGTANIITAMNDQQIKRLVVISAMGVAESWPTLSFINKLFFAILLRNTRLDHEKQEALVKKSGLDWTIVRPSGLTDTSVTGVYATGENIRAVTSKIARADVAHFILKELLDNANIRKAVTITH
ncbi:MAG: SDR family oxidoreductase [Anaerolineales bacterium]|nr:MAG: SDR family oxidoreductase [Anaerolineales bacterium]